MWYRCTILVKWILIHALLVKASASSLTSTSQATIETRPQSRQPQKVPGLAEIWRHNRSCHAWCVVQDWGELLPTTLSKAALPGINLHVQRSIQDHEHQWSYRTESEMRRGNRRTSVNPLEWILERQSDLPHTLLNALPPSRSLLELGSPLSEYTRALCPLRFARYPWRLAKRLRMCSLGCLAGRPNTVETCAA